MEAKKMNDERTMNERVNAVPILRKPVLIDFANGHTISVIPDGANPEIMAGEMVEILIWKTETMRNVKLGKNDEALRMIPIEYLPELLILARDGKFQGMGRVAANA